MGCPSCFPEDAGHSGLGPSPKHIPGGPYGASCFHPQSNGLVCRRRAVARLLSVVCLGGDRVDREGPERELLLALSGLRRDLEPCPPDGSRPGTVAAMNDREPGTRAEMSRARTVRELHELIAALDRRVPQVQRVGEIAIARAAAELRAEALRRIEELEREPVKDTVPGDPR